MAKQKKQTKPNVEQVTVKVISKNPLRLRADASTEAPIKMLLDPGTELKVIEDVNDEWVRVKLNAATNGFVMKKFVE